MTPAIRFLIKQASQNIHQMSNQEKELLWKGITEVLPKNSRESQLAHLNLITLREAERAQGDFLQLLKD